MEEHLWYLYEETKGVEELIRKQKKKMDTPTSIIKKDTPPIQPIEVQEIEKEEDKPKIVMKGRLSPERIEKIMARRRVREAKENQQQKRGNVIDEVDTLFEMDL